MSPNEKIQNQIETAFKNACGKISGNAEPIIEMFVRWISGGLISSTGGFIVTKISNVKMTFEDFSHAKFSCKVTALMAPDYTKIATAKYNWKLVGMKYHGNYTAPKMVG